VAPAQQSREETFGDVFYELGIPLLAADMRCVREAIDGRARDGVEDAVQSHLIFPLGPPTDRRFALSASLQAIFDSVRIPIEGVQFLSTSVALRDNPAQQVFIESCDPATTKFLAFEQEDGVFWQETSLWPMAYGPQLEQLTALMELHRRLIEQRREQLSLVTIISEYPRMLPTRLHYAFASLGAWLGGATNVQYFGLAASAPQAADSDVNLAYAQVCGYSSDDARELDASGILAVPAEVRDALMQAQGTDEVFGSIPPDEVNIANLPAPPEPSWRSDLTGLIVDKNYRASFNSRPLIGAALYGAHDVPRDHYEDFYAELEPTFLLRCKHYCAPVVEVSSLDEIRTTVGGIPDLSVSGMVFRGQSKLFCLPRSDRVRRLLFGDSCATEPSLSSSASRAGDDYDELHFALRYYLTELVLSQGDAELVARWRADIASPLCELDYALMALAQHYGLPTHGLDVTTDLGVAAWFATNRLSITDDGAAAYSTLTSVDWPASPADWPMLFVHQAVTHSTEPSLQDCQELEAFGFVAQRPSRQCARFFLGGHSDHQNRLAETLVCAFRLRPGDYETELTFDELFPSPDEDVAYRLLLDFAEWWSPASGRVLRFH
jgi:FRG domain